MSRCANCDSVFVPEWKQNKWTEYCSNCDWKESPKLTREELEQKMKEFYERQQNDN